MAGHRRWGGRGKRTKVRKEGFILGGGGQEGMTAQLGGAQGAGAVAGRGHKGLHREVTHA